VGGGCGLAGIGGPSARKAERTEWMAGTSDTGKDTLLVT